MKINSNDIFFTCSLIELIGRNTLRKRSDVVSLLGKKNIAHIYAHADTLHCEPIAKTADTFIELCKITKGDFDNVAACKYAVPEYWAIGKVYARLIEDVHDGDDVVETLLNVYKSPISDMISNYNSDLFYQSRGFIKEFFLSNGYEFEDRNDHCPALRFRGFTDAWEQRKLGDFTNVLSASRVHKNEWATEGVPFYRSCDVVSAFKGNDNEKAFISVSLYEELIKLSGKLEQDDILITGGGSIGIPYIVPNNKPLYSKDADLIWIKKSNKHNSKYLYTYFTCRRFRDYINSISHVGTIAHYTIEQVKNSAVLLPKIEEQNLISVFFSQIDHLITLHQRKYLLLEVLLC